MDTAQFDSWSQLIVAILSAGGGAALLALISGFIKWLNGSAHRERLRNTDLIEQRMRAIEERDQALDERDDAERKKREAYEHASRLTRQLLELGVSPAPWVFKDGEEDEGTIPKDLLGPSQ